MISLSLGTTFRYLRKRRGLTLTQLAERCEMSVSYLSEIERGKANPAIMTLTTIAYELGYELIFKFKARDDDPPI